MSYLAKVESLLAAIEESDRLRTIGADDPAATVDFSNNDYLALACDPRVVAAMRRCERVGAGGARLLGGRHREHADLEAALAAFLGREKVLLFSSGYLAAHGAVSVLSQCAGAIYSDALNHACIIDAVRATQLPREVFAHRALPGLAARTHGALVISESIFSMEGDAAPLEAMLADLREDDILLIDEAHALGVAGPQGRGLAWSLRDPRVVIMGTLSKSLGAQGGFIAGPARLIDLLVTSARTFIFDTALAPPLAAAARAALAIIESDPDRRSRLHTNVARLRAGLSVAVSDTHAESPIVPIVLGDERRALDLARLLRSRGIIATAIRPPTVPAGTSRLRLGVRSDHTNAEIDLLLDALACTATS